MQASLTQALGAEAPLSIVVDATILEAMRTVSAKWAPEDVTAHREGAEALVRTIAARLGCAVIVGAVVEEPDANEKRLFALDPTEKLRDARRTAIADKIRSTLPTP